MRKSTQYFYIYESTLRSGLVVALQLQFYTVNVALHYSYSYYCQHSASAWSFTHLFISAGTFTNSRASAIDFI